MVSIKHVDEQLRQIGYSFQMWGRSEIKELCNILMPGEQISECVMGHYEGGFAMLCSTNSRILLVDRKPMYLTLEDVRYDMISEMDYGYRLMNATVRIFTPNKSLHFTSWNQQRLRSLLQKAQNRVMEIRHYQLLETHIQTQQPYQPAPLYPGKNVPSQAGNNVNYNFPNPAPAPVVQQQPNMNNNLNPAYGTLTGLPPNPVNPINPFARMALTTRRRNYWN